MFLKKSDIGGYDGDGVKILKKQSRTNYLKQNREIKQQLTESENFMPKVLFLKGRLGTRLWYPNFDICLVFPSTTFCGESTIS